jgi:hypothetical protein
MRANKPDMAKRWEKHTPDNAKLPEKAKEKKAAAVHGITKAAAPVGPAGIDSSKLFALALTGAGGMLGGTALGYGASRLASPSVMSNENLKKEEQVTNYDRLISAVKARMAAKKARMAELEGQRSSA